MTEKKFRLSKKAKLMRKEFASKADPKIILAHSCDQTKLEVLYYQMNRPEVLDWLSKRLEKIVGLFKEKSKFKHHDSDGSYDKEDDLQNLFMDILIVYRFRGKWTDLGYGLRDSFRYNS